jgi:hypothetical protein
MYLIYRCQYLNKHFVTKEEINQYEVRELRELFVQHLAQELQELVQSKTVQLCGLCQ